MSVDFNVYVGPYLDIREPITTSTIDFCETHDRGAGDFCSQCGKAESRRFAGTANGPLGQGFWGHGSWIDRLQDATSRSYESSIDDGVRTVRAISNYSGFGVHVSRGDSTVAHAIPTSEGFAEALAHEIARIRELGCSVEIKLGVLVWYS